MYFLCACLRLIFKFFLCMSSIDFYCCALKLSLFVIQRGYWDFHFKGRSYPDFFPASRLRFGWVASNLSLFSVTNNVTRHICHISGKNVTLLHTNFFFNLWLFLLHPSRKTSLFGPAGTKLFETERNVTIRLGLKHSYLFPSQICHLSQKREGHLG